MEKLNRDNLGPLLRRNQFLIRPYCFFALLVCVPIFIIRATWQARHEFSDDLHLILRGLIKG